MFLIITSFGVIQFLVTIWLKSRLEKSIEHEYEKQLEEYRFAILKREQAARVAELFAFWLSCDDDVLREFSKKEMRDHSEKLNRLTWELAIWIPDEKIVKDIMDKLSHGSKKDIKEIILSIREQIQKENSKELKWTNIVSFKYHR